MSPFFIFYCPRSGSNFLSKTLVEKLGVVIPPESRFFTKVLTKAVPPTKLLAVLWFNAILMRDRKFQDWQVDQLSLTRYLLTREYRTRRDLNDGLMEYYFRQIGVEGKPLNEFGFKWDSYANHVDWINRYYPESRYICLLRDGRAVYSSQKQSVHSETGRPMASNVTKSARAWVAWVERFQRIQERYPQQTIQIKYEELLTDTDAVLGQIAQHLGLEARLESPAPDALEYVVPERYQELHKNVFKPSLPERIGAWRHELTAEEIAEYEVAAQGALEACGYV